MRTVAGSSGTPWITAVAGKARYAWIAAVVLAFGAGLYFMAHNNQPTTQALGGPPPNVIATIGGVPQRPASMRAITPADLPKEAQQTLQLIAVGGPYPYKQDGVVFSNRENMLPRAPTGYYHEYTVRTPGAPNRGGRRIITGAKGERYYTDDHYATFVWIDSTGSTS